MSFFKRLFKGKAREPHGLNAAAIFPVLRTVAPGANAPVEIPPDRRPIAEPLAADILVCYAVDTPTMLRFICPGDCAQLNIPLSGLRDLALDNLKRMVPSINLEPYAPFFRVSGGQGHEATVLLSDKFYHSMRSMVLGEVVVAAPGRDLLIFTGSDVTGAVEELTKIVEDVYPQMQTPLSRHLLTRRDGKWIEHGPAKAAA